MRRPTVVVLFGFLNILFGLFGALGTVVSALVVYGPGRLNAAAQDNPFVAHEGPLGAWLKLSVFLSAALCAVLIVSGFGLLAMRDWARKLSMAYAVFSVFSLIINLFVFVAVPMMQRGGAPANEQDATVVAGAVGSMIGGCVGLIYPLLLWYFMTRRNVVAALSGNGGLVSAADIEFAPAAGSGTNDLHNPYGSPLTASGGNLSPLEMSDSVAEALVPSKNGAALAAYYLGLFSLMPVLGFPMGIAAVYFGIQGLRKVRANPAVRGGVHAWVGVVCGSLFGLFNLLLIAGVIMMIVVGMSRHR